MNKIISICLVLVMMLSTVSFAALADEPEFPLPECTVEEIKGEDLVLSSDEQFSGHDEITLDYALNFTALDDEEDLAISPYADYLADFELTFDDDVQVILAGQYDTFNPTWVVLDDIEYGDFVAPKGGLDFTAGETVKIMEKFGETFANPGSNPAFTYADCVKWVKSFNCGIKVVSDKDVNATLALKIYETEVDRGAGENGQNIYTTTGVEYTVFERSFEYKGAIDLSTSEAVNNIKIDSYTSDETLNNIAAAIKSFDAESAANVKADIIGAVAEDKGNYAVVPGTNTGLAISYVAAESDNVILKKGAVLDVTATVDGDEVTELAHPVLVKIPVDSIGLTDGKKIEKIYHEHEGVIEELDFFVKDGFVWVRMSKFSLISIVLSSVPAAASAELKLVAAPAEDGKAAFDVILYGDTANTVRNLSAGEFTLEYPAGVGAKYELIPNKTVDINKDVIDDNTVKYYFSVVCDNVEDIWTADDANIINNGIKIATLEITGRNVEGTISFGDFVEMEKSFINANGTQTAPIAVTAGDDVDFEIGVPTKKLTVVADLDAYRIKNQGVNYQSMTLVVTGKDIDTKEIKLGADNSDIDFEITGNGVIYTCEIDLPENGIYKLELSAPGYRKADYELSMNYDKTVTFWNNHKNAKKAMEEFFIDATEKRADGKVFSNFLAGDIVDDNIINEYDLSAVVSYFGESTTDFTTASRFVTYDINRDGKVDSKDVAIVLAGVGK